MSVLVMLALGLPLACQQSSPPTGELLAFVSTNVDLPTQMDRIHVEVRSGDTAGDAGLYSADYHLDPQARDHYALPATIGVVPSGDARRSVDIQVVGFLGHHAVLFQRMRTQVPRGRVALMPLPLNVDCLEDVAPSASGTYTSTRCADGQ